MGHKSKEKGSWIRVPPYKVSLGSCASSFRGHPLAAVPPPVTEDSPPLKWGEGVRVTFIPSLLHHNRHKTLTRAVRALVVLPGFDWRSPSYRVNKAEHSFHTMVKSRVMFSTYPHCAGHQNMQNKKLGVSFWWDIGTCRTTNYSFKILLAEPRRAQKGPAKLGQSSLGCI